jgi:hypothetical protein
MKGQVSIKIASQGFLKAYGGDYRPEMSGNAVHHNQFRSTFSHEK